MDEFKSKAGEKFDALHEVAKSAAGTGKNKVENVYHSTADALKRFRGSFHEVWNHELIVECRDKIASFFKETIKRIKEGAPPLSPVLLYEELKTLLKDRVWRRSLMIFGSGFAVGAVTAVLVLKAGRAGAAGPRHRAILTCSDQGVVVVDDAVASGAGTGEVLIRVQSFSVCPLDRHVLRGYAGTLRALVRRTSLTVGRGFAGVVLDVGYGVEDLELGDEVWGCVSEWAGGAASELLTLRSTRVSKRPFNLAADLAASLPWTGGNVLAALDALRYTHDNVANKRILVCGAGSGEGSLLVQLLSSRGGRVCAVVPRVAALAVKEMGATDIIESEHSSPHSAWEVVERFAATSGPFDAAIVCDGWAGSEAPNRHAIIKATAPRRSIVDLRPRSLISDKLPIPFSLVFAASFYSYRVLRWLAGRGTHTDWMENKYRLSEGLLMLTKLVETGQLTPVLDKVFMPQDFETALAHACSDEAIGTTVIRFP